MRQLGKSSQCVLSKIMGYHKTKITKGKYGESSKIKEEIEELQDAERQNNKIMALVELSDIVGAIHGYLQRQYPNITMQDLVIMSNATRSAFMDGTRS